MEKIRVLLVEDEPTLAEIIRETLETMDFVVAVTKDGTEGMQRFFELRPDILVTDVMMPKMSGFELVGKIRRTDKRTPVLFLTAKTTVEDVVKGFELGANDYLKKPFAIQELTVRIKALLDKARMEHVSATEPSGYDIGDYFFHPESKTLRHIPTADVTVVPQREAEILRRLCKGRGSIVPTQNMLLDLWGDDDYFNLRSFQVLITRLRRHLSKDPQLRIVNVRGTGYKLVCQDRVSP